MKVVAEVFKILLLGAITILLMVNVGILEKPKPIKSAQNIAIIERSTAKSNQREHDLKKIIEHNLTKFFKFPGAVKFQNTKFDYKLVFKNHNINVEPENELEFSTMCGQYSASNAMGIYGAFEPFYAEIAVDNVEKGITGFIYLKIDGKIKKSLDLDSGLLIDEDEVNFKKLYSKNCGDTDKFYMGVFSEYEFNYDALDVGSFSEALDKLSKFPEATESINKCLETGGTHNYCITVEHCQWDELADNFKELCAIRKQVCVESDKPRVCELKIDSVYKEKESQKNKR